MSWSVGGIGGNVSASSFLGAALHSANLLNVPKHAIDHFIHAHKELTSPFPFIGEKLSSAISAGQHVAGDAAAAVTHAVASHIPGHHGR